MFTWYTYYKFFIYTEIKYILIMLVSFIIILGFYFSMLIYTNLSILKDMRPLTKLKTDY